MIKLMFLNKTGKGHIMLNQHFVDVEIPTIIAWIKRNVGVGEKVTVREIYDGIKLANPIAPTTFAVYYSQAMSAGYFSGLLEGGRGRKGYCRIDDKPRLTTAPVRSIVNVKKTGAMQRFLDKHGVEGVGVMLLGLAAKHDMSPKYLAEVRAISESLTEALAEVAE